MSAEKLKATLDEAHGHLDRAIEHHEAGRHSAVKRRIELARGCIQRAIDGVYQEPTHSAPQGPSQGSAGQTQGTSGPPRSFDPEVRRQQDQMRSCQIAFDVRQRQMRGLR
jgi:hypothetical protein